LESLRTSWAFGAGIAVSALGSSDTGITAIAGGALGTIKTSLPSLAGVAL
jgi:hypothetical protein